MVASDLIFALLLFAWFGRENAAENVKRDERKWRVKPIKRTRTQLFIILKQNYEMHCGIAGVNHETSDFVYLWRHGFVVFVCFVHSFIRLLKGVCIHFINNTTE